MKRLGKIFDLIQEYIMIITGVAVTILILVAAAARYIFKIDFYGSEEITLFFAFWLYFIGSMYAAKNNTHINASMISMFVKNKKTIKKIEIIKDCITLFLVVIVTYWCFNYVSWSFTMNARSNVFKLPNVIAQLPILFSFIAWVFYAFRDVYEGIKSLAKIKEEDINQDEKSFAELKEDQLLKVKR